MFSALTKKLKELSNCRLFVDYLRNGEGSTAVLPYSVRARKGAPVALPLTWAEMKKLKSANEYSLNMVLTLLKKKKEGPWKRFTSVQQDLPLLKAS